MTNSSTSTSRQNSRRPVGDPRAARQPRQDRAAVGQTEQAEHAEQGDLGQQQDAVRRRQVGPPAGPQQAVDQAGHPDRGEAPARDDRVAGDGRGQVGAEPPRRAARAPRAHRSRGPRRRGAPPSTTSRCRAPTHRPRGRAAPAARARRARARRSRRRRSGSRRRATRAVTTAATVVISRSVRPRSICGDEDTELLPEARPRSPPGRRRRAYVRTRCTIDSTRPGAGGEPRDEQAARVGGPVRGADAGAGVADGPVAGGREAGSRPPGRARRASRTRRAPTRVDDAGSAPPDDRAGVAQERRERRAGEPDAEQGERDGGQREHDDAPGSQGSASTGSPGARRRRTHVLSLGRRRRCGGRAARGSTWCSPTGDSTRTSSLGG